MNILVLNGSPKGARSNTLRLTEAFLAGICEAREVHIERLTVHDLDIRSCLGCFACWSKTPGKCCLHDDMGMALEKMLWADLTIWSFPLYYFSVPGKLKTLMDRQLPLNLPFMSAEAASGGHPTRYDMSGKKTVIISTCGFYTAEGNYEAVTAQFDHMCGKGRYTTLFCGQGELFRVPELAARTDAYLALVRQAGREYAAGGIAPTTNAQLQELLYPREAFERMADASWGVTETGEQAEPALLFTRQMAALYNPAAYPGRDILLDMDYTDVGKCYRVVLGKKGSQVLEDFTGAATTTVRTPLTVWKAIAAGELSGPTAMMEHKYTVEGDLDPLLHWDDYFGPQAHTPTAKKPKETRTNMACLLLPWIAFWVAGSIHSFWGAVVSLLVCSAMPLVFLKSRRTVYDALSFVLVSGCSVALLAGVPNWAVMPLSYLAFGVLWSVSAFLKVPLSAEYSMYGYGGESALENPVFIKTNRILTAVWGVLYLITPIWTFLLMQTPAGRFIGLINAVLPAVLGGFTAWFQKWYPKKVAQGR